MSNPQSSMQQRGYRPIVPNKKEIKIFDIENASKSGALFYVPDEMNFMLRMAFLLSLFLFPMFLVWKQFFLPLLVCASLIYIMRVAIDHKSEKLVKKMASIYSFDDIESMIETRKLDADVSRRAKLFLIRNGHQMRRRTLQ